MRQCSAGVFTRAKGTSAPVLPHRARACSLLAADRRPSIPPSRGRPPVPPSLRVAKARLERRDQLAQRHVQAARDEDQRLERRRPPGLLKLANVVARDAGRVRQLLLRHPTTRPQLAHSERQGATLAREGINHARQPRRAPARLPDVSLGIVPKDQCIHPRIGGKKSDMTGPRPRRRYSDSRTQSEPTAPVCLAISSSQWKPAMAEWSCGCAIRAQRSLSMKPRRNNRSAIQNARVPNRLT